MVVIAVIRLLRPAVPGVGPSAVNKSKTNDVAEQRSPKLTPTREVVYATRRC